MYPTDQEAIETIISIGRRMYERNFVSANDGNITIRVADDAVWATPTGVSKGSLRPDMLIKANFDGKILEGNWKPTIELTMHLNVYKADDEVMSTAHAHPPYLTTFACAGIEFDLPIDPAASAIVGRIPVTPYYCPGSKELAEAVMPYVKNYHVVNLGNHGAIAWGKRPIEAWYRLVSGEAACEVALLVVNLGRLRPLTTEQIQCVLDVNHIDLAPECTLTGAKETTNQQPRGIALTEYLKTLRGGL